MMNLQTINDILSGEKKLQLADNEIKNITDCYQFLTTFSKDKVIYGINTGFGPMAQYRVSDQNLIELQYNIVRSHATGAGEPLPPTYVKAAMISRYCTFVAGKSGVHIDVVEQIKNFINKDIIPFIPQHGSVGASGDLVQLAHIALCLIGEGEVFYKGQLVPTREALQQEHLPALQLKGRDGLSLVNGTAVMTGISTVNLLQTAQLISASLLTSTLMNEIFASYDDFFSDTLNKVKYHRGQRKIAALMSDIAQDNHCMRNRQKDLYAQKHNEQFFGNETKIQPYYSLRCVPQVLGPIYDTWLNALQVIVNEVNSVDDNPIVDPETQNIYHGGNFHGDYISLEMDKLKMAVTKMTILAERQMNYLFHDRINGILPPFVNLGTLGLNYGLQAAQFTATSTTAESQTLSNPMYVHSIPNNNDNQDVVSMGTNAALLTKKVIENAYQVLAIHSIALAQAVDCLKIQDQLSPATSAFYHDIRNLVPVFIQDSPKYKEIACIIDYLHKDWHFFDKELATTAQVD